MDLFDLGLIFLIVILLILLSWIWPPDSPWAPWWRTNKKTSRSAFKLASVKKGDIVYELGSGEATALIVAVEEFGARGVGIEIEPLRYLLSKFTVFRRGLGGDIKLVRGNFFNEDLTGASVVFVYLVPKTLNRLKPKLLKELKPGTRIISAVYEIPGGLTNKPSGEELRPKGLIRSLKTAVNKKEIELFLYKIPK
ncbi:MAG: SAM-dependent methyltransferase [Candidatus Levybacteria bacterium]|nr:SAM-dependent methyltransferase [Candidatus Levybacteria bacterium]